MCLKVFVKPVILKFLHNFVAIAAYVVGIASILLQVDDNKDLWETTTQKDILMMAFYLITAYSLHKAVVSLFNQVRSTIA